MVELIQTVYVANLPHQPAGCILGVCVAGVVFLYTAILYLYTKPNPNSNPIPNAIKY